MSSHQAAAAAEPLLPQHQRNGGPLSDADGPPPEDAAAGSCRDGSIKRWIMALSFVFYMLNCCLTVYWYKGPAFMFSNLSLLDLLVCLKWYDKAEPGSQLRGRLKVAVWLLTTALALSFSYMVASVAPPALAMVACLMAFGTVAGALYYLWPKM